MDIRNAMIVLVLVLTGCVPPQQGVKLGDMLPGKMFSLKDGNEYNFAIQVSYDTGAMTAFNPSTNERFSGQYTAIITSGGVSQGVAKDSWGMSAGTVTTVSTATANARGILKGDAGTVIDVYLDIQPGNRPTGHGTGVDNKEVRYQIQF